MAAKKYRVIHGINYPGKGDREKRAEPGDLVDDLPEKAIGSLLRQGAIADPDEVSKSEAIEQAEADDDEEATE